MNRPATFFVSNRRHIIVIVLLILAVICASIYVWHRKITVDLDRIRYQSFNDFEEALIGDTNVDGDIRQSFVVSGTFEGVFVKFNAKPGGEGAVDVSIFDLTNNVLIHQEILNHEDIITGEYHNIKFDQLYGFEEDTTYEMVVTFDSSDDAISVWCSNSDVFQNGSLTISGKLVDGDMNFGLILRNLEKITVAYVTVFVILGLSLVMLYVFIYVFRSKVHIVFLAVAIPFGLIYSLIMSPGVVPDEAAHMDMAYRYSNQMMCINHVDDVVIRYRSTDVDNWILTSKPGSEHYQKLLHTPFWATEGTENNALVASKTANAYALLYVPSALGVTFARMIHLGTIPMLYLGRLCNFIVFLVGVYFAIKISPVGKNIFFISSLLPMTMHQAFSFSYDSIMTGGMFLLIAMFLRAIYTEDLIRLRDKLLILVISIIVLPGKAIYIFVTLLSLLIPRARFGGMKKKILFVGALFLLTGMAYLAVNLSAISTLASGSQPALHVGEAYDMNFIFSNPVRTIIIFVNTLLYNSSYYVKTLVGERLGWLEIYIPTALVLLALGISAAAFFHDTGEAYTKVTKAFLHRLLYVGIFASVVLAAMLTMLFAYTKFGSDIIDGVQGRYFIPALPLFGLAVYCRYVKIESGILKHLYMATGCLHFAVLFFLI